VVGSRLCQEEGPDSVSNNSAISSGSVVWYQVVHFEFDLFVRLR
jgi:hypothetical protein